jgi:beta-galactosidase/beta-glucuronidase
VLASTSGTAANDLIEVRVMDNGKVIGTGKAVVGQEVTVAVPNAKLWSPESPFLYDMEVSILHNGVATDKLKSYFGMRKISTQKDANGIHRMQLNNKDYFQFGPLDQGWWPDGLYTAPTDEALVYDIKKTKDFGFNMIRKHVKVEPARWYYHCDREGILVWQDMPSGDANPKWQTRNYFNGQELQRSKLSEQNFIQEWKEIMDLTYSNPSVVVTVPFNEAWGQHNSMEIGKMAVDYDKTRAINIASGGNFWPVGDIADRHNYPNPAFPLEDKRFDEYIKVVGEFGGHGWPVKDHLWKKNNDNWGYGGLPKSIEEWKQRYSESINILRDLRGKGLAAGVYTQTTDVEMEVNGLLTYDRVNKIDPSWLKGLADKLLAPP